jgi:hypothetical protein
MLRVLQPSRGKWYLQRHRSCHVLSSHHVTRMCSVTSDCWITWHCSDPTTQSCRATPHCSDPLRVGSGSTLHCRNPVVPCSHIWLAFNVLPASHLAGVRRRACHLASWKIRARPDVRLWWLCRRGIFVYLNSPQPIVRSYPVPGGGS